MANKYFKQFIQIDKNPKTLSVPNGSVAPKYCIYFSFPSINAITYKAKFLLLPNLPTKILADINMLIEFGFKFESGLPPVFRHKIMLILKQIGEI